MTRYILRLLAILVALAAACQTQQVQVVVSSGATSTNSASSAQLLPARVTTSVPPSTSDDRECALLDNVLTPGRIGWDFTIELLTGDLFRASDHFGRNVIVIYFWATNCPRCLPALQRLEGLYKKYNGRGVVVLGVAMDQNESDSGRIRAVVRAQGLTFPVAHDLNGVTEVYNPNTCKPFQIILTRDSRIFERHGDPFKPGDERRMESVLKSALGKE